MSERKYSVSEIDQMRAVLRIRVAASFFRAFPNGGWSDGPIPDFPAQAEDQLRTYMLAGIEPNELA